MISLFALTDWNPGQTIRMSTRRNQNRLKVLEAAHPPRPKENDKLVGFLHKLRFLANAHYLGNPQPNKSIMQAYERALGVERIALLFKTSPETITQHEFMAWERLLEIFGVSRSDDWDRLADAFLRMADGFCERYRQALESCAQEYAVVLPLA